MRVQRGSGALEVAYYPIVRYVLPMGGPMRTISIKLPEGLDRALTELAKRCNASRSALLRQALEAFTKRQVRSVLEAAGDLARIIHDFAPASLVLRLHRAFAALENTGSHPGDL